VSKEEAEEYAEKGVKVTMELNYDKTIKDSRYIYKIRRLTSKWLFTEYLPNNDKITYHITDIRDKKGFLLYRRVNVVKKDQDDKEYDAELQKSVFSYDAEEYTDGSKLAVYEKDGSGRLLSNRIYSLRSFGLLMKKIDYTANKTYTYKWPPRSEKIKYVDSGQPAEVEVYDDYDSERDDNTPISILKLNGDNTDNIPLTDIPVPIMGIRNGVVSYNVYYVEEARFMADKMQYKQEYSPEGVFVEEEDIMNSQIIAWRVFSRDTMKLNRILVNKISQQGADFNAKSYKWPIRNAGVAEDCERDFDAGAGTSQYCVGDAVTVVSYEMENDSPSQSKSGTTKTVNKAEQEKPPEDKAEIDKLISNLESLAQKQGTTDAELEAAVKKLAPYINDHRVVVALAKVLFNYSSFRSESVIKIIDLLFISNDPSAIEIVLRFPVVNYDDYIFNKLNQMIKDPAKAVVIAAGILDSGSLGRLRREKIFLRVIKAVSNDVAVSLVKAAIQCGLNGHGAVEIAAEALSMEPLEYEKMHAILNALIAITEDAAKDTNKNSGKFSGKSKDCWSKNFNQDFSECYSKGVLAIQMLSLMLIPDVDPIAPHGYSEALVPLQNILLTDSNDPDLRYAAAIALGRIGNPDAVGILKKMVFDSDDTVCKGAITGLGYLGISDRDITMNLREKLAICSDDATRAAIFWTLGAIGTEEALEPLSFMFGKENKNDRETAEYAVLSILMKLPPEDSEKLIDNNPNIKSLIDSNTAKCTSLKTDCGVDILGGKWYTPDTLGTIDTTLRGLFESHREWVEGVTIGKEECEDVAPGAAGVYYNKKDYYGVPIITIDRDVSGSAVGRVLFHEIGHHVDYEFFNNTEFEDLYAASNKQDVDDFARLYGKTNFLEDAATTFEAYLINTGEAFRDALDRAKPKEGKEGKTIYLTKLLTVLDITTGTTKSETGSTTGQWYQAIESGSEYKLSSKDITITRGSRDGKEVITKINDVDVYTLGGGYNLDGLNNLYEKIVGE
jgi:hypothetical protein